MSGYEKAKNFHSDVRLIMFLAASIFFCCYTGVIPRKYFDFLFFIWGITVVLDMFARIRMKRAKRLVERQKQQRMSRKRRIAYQSKRLE